MGKRRLLAGFAAVLATTSLALAPGTAAGAHGATHQDEYKRVGYFIQWGIYGRQYYVKNLETSGQAARLTHINYAFAGIDKTGTKCESVDPWADYQRPVSAEESVDGVADVAGQPLAGNFNQLKKLKAKHPGLKVLLSLGGWTLSSRFSDVALTDASRQTFVKSCVDTFLSTGVFDGFDLDWEWPGSEGNAGNVIRPEDRQNFTKLAAEFRKQLGKDKVLTAFLPAAPAKMDAGFEANKIFKYLDFGTVQGYDFHGTWEPTTNQQSALFVPRNAPTTPDFSGSSALKAWTDRGAPKKQLVLGIPYYGQGWTGVTDANRGLFQPATGAAKGTWADGNEDYKVLATLPQQGYKVYHDLLSGQAWLFNGTTFWTYDDPIVVAQKGLYVRLAGYGGAMVWSLDGDDANGSLTKAMYTTLR
ncbi:glycoside hydrolase family 18 protein [Dactylosporangium vinaceum]|uniref:chitinase n=1 Tax=Dactylosporangium vinaceum TaxID=53362 RepID=A0ABV5M0U2_9ACTN|nr:glycoside hydrolase family 18 protein [Dactylosporangium vinaceum]UAB97360.1 glycoside hydrolase family 18 protein [Dactylosporangium vinaceum]